MEINRGDAKIRTITWDCLQELTTKLVSKITADQIRFDVIVAISRGGLIPGRMVADSLGIREIQVLGIKYYSNLNQLSQAVLLQRPNSDMTGKRVLIVDDISDSGKTLEIAQRELPGTPAVLKSATIFTKPWSTVMPDYFAEITEDWIVFPWEQNEFRAVLSSVTAVHEQRQRDGGEAN
ncbi:MAG: phosphoribosyltransferase [Thermoprotei archaeon]